MKQLTKGFLNIFNNNRKITTAAKFKFAVRKTINGRSIQYIPVAKAKGLFSDWTPIVKIHDEYLILPYEVEGLSNDNCLEIIQHYKNQLEKEDVNSFFQVEYSEC
jgi:hypothetical protein